jgi:hypothetical protein
MVTHTCIPSTGKAEEEDHEFEASLTYSETLYQNKTNSPIKPNQKTTPTNRALPYLAVLGVQ